MRFRWGKSADETLTRLWEEGLSAQQIARFLNVSERAVIHRRERLGLAPRLLIGRPTEAQKAIPSPQSKAEAILAPRAVETRLATILDTRSPETKKRATEIVDRSEDGQTVSMYAVLRTATRLSRTDREE